MNGPESQQVAPIQYQEPLPSNRAPSSFPLKKLFYILIVILVFFFGIIVGYYFRLAKEPKLAIEQPTPTSYPGTQTPIIQVPTSTPTTPISEESTILIKNSGSTNFPAAALLIQTDGSGNITYTGQSYQLQHVSSPTKSFPKGTFNTVVNVISQISNVSQIPTAMCAKSISFGSTTKVIYKGFSSGDLQCIDSSAPQMDKDLANEVQKALTLAQNY